MEKKQNTEPSVDEMKQALLDNGWFENLWNSSWGNTEEPGFWNLRQAFGEIERINNLRHERTKGWKFIPDMGA